VKSRQVCVYGLARDAAGRTLLTSAHVLPGGVVGHGQDPRDAMIRAVQEQTGLRVRVEAVHQVSTHLSDDGLAHTDRIVFEVVPDGGSLAPAATWARVDDVPLGDPPAPSAGKPDRHQRFGAYAVATDPADRLLLTLISAGYPGAGQWHLPGGGTDHGETAEEALARELIEETSQTGRIVGLIGADHNHHPAAVGPEGVPMDWHTIRVFYRVFVDNPTEVLVSEAAGGSTTAAGWFGREEVALLPLSRVARAALAETAGDEIS
jgi:8-oxo-dGTP diphosphatase